MIQGSSPLDICRPPRRGGGAEGQLRPPSLTVVKPLTPSFFSLAYDFFTYPPRSLIGGPGRGALCDPLHEYTSQT
jgi:hypothetical protein